ncbi:MAG: hypothetical protein WBK77_09620 [Alphaproteobacteria bacterium]
MSEKTLRLLDFTKEFLLPVLAHCGGIIQEMQAGSLSKDSAKKLMDFIKEGDIGRMFAVAQYACQMQKGNPVRNWGIETLKLVAVDLFRSNRVGELEKFQEAAEFFFEKHPEVLEIWHKTVFELEKDRQNHINSIPEELREMFGYDANDAADMDGGPS